MVIKRSSSAEIARLLEALLGPDPEAAEAAAARLAILGIRAVDRLAATLPDLQHEPELLAVLDVLERIGDPRGAAAAEPCLRDPRDPVAEAAVAVVRRTLQDPDTEAAARAADALVGVALDAAGPPARRQSALDALSDLPPETLEPLRRTLPRELVPTAPAPVEGGPPPGEHRDAWLASWTEGASAEAPPSTVREAFQAAGRQLPLPVLHRAIERLRGLEAQASEAQRDDWRTLRGLIHQALAARGSRVALYDLRETFERHPDTVTVTMLAAAAAVGDASCLESIAQAWDRCRNDWMKGQLHETFAAIVTRERLTRRHTVLRRVAAHHPALVAAPSRPSRTRPSRRPGDRT